jgi:hypothetical protein
VRVVGSDGVGGFVQIGKTFKIARHECNNSLSAFHVKVGSDINQDHGPV